ncbi:MAG TPA: hypothetical protein VFZ23_12940 [Pyrinomonadaceae bacterium]
MRQTRYFLTAILFLVLASAVGSAQISDRKDGMRFVPDPINQVFYLSETADALGLNITTTPNPSTCRHYQGIVRTEDSEGTPFFLVTRSGNTPFPPGEIGCDDSPGETRNGHLVVFKMESRDKNGERLRSNRLLRNAYVDFTPPVMALDRATVYFTFTGGIPKDPDPAKRPGLVLRDGPNDLPPRAYQHPGGMQQVGNVLAVALETPRPGGYWSDYILCVQGSTEACDRYNSYEKSTNGNIVQFYDISNPEEPKFLSQFTPRNSAGENLSKLGVVGITPLQNGKYLMVVTGGGGNSWFFYRSLGTDLSSEDLTWEQVRTPLAPEVDDPHQTLNFIREENIDGRLFIAGARGHVEIGPWYEDRERIDLYEVSTPSKNFEPGEDITITTHVNAKRISPRPSTGGTQLASLAAGSTFYISPSGEVILYATEHDNDGPSGTMKAGEFRHVDMARPGSPTFFPNAHLNGPYTVNEGSAINMTATGEQPANKAFIQLFHRTNFGPRYLTASYEDREKEEFENLFKYETFLLAGNLHADKARSWNWYAPQGCSIQAVDRVNEASPEPDELKTLTGATSVQADADLSLVMHDGGTDDIDQEIDRVLFGQDCDSYYSAPIGLFWDLDRNGSYETQGNSANFSAVDGPATLQIPVEARNTLGGPAGSKKATVTVMNVAPQLSQFALVDSGGNPINSTVPWVLTGLPITVSANFTDPGRLDHQTSAISWGDGTSDAHTAYNAFDEAFGDGTGSLSDTHVYNTPGTYAIDLTVTDSDLDSGAASATVRVLTPAQAVAEIVAMIDAAIAASTNPQVIAQLQQARNALTGINNTSQSGALHMIQTGNNEAAIAFLDTCSIWLQRAATGGADVAVPIALTQQVATALAR